MTRVSIKIVKLKINKKKRGIKSKLRHRHWPELFDNSLVLFAQISWAAEEFGVFKLAFSELSKLKWHSSQTHLSTYTRHT